jgi:polyadenylation factor subunit 2
VFRQIYKPIGIAAHKVYSGGEIVDVVPITSLAWSNHSNLLVSGDRDGLLHYCDETFRFVLKVPEAHNGPIRGLSYSPMDSKLVSCSDDGMLHIWTVGSSTPDKTLTGHQSDVKCVDWHPYRSLICSGSRDSAVKLWDPRNGTNVR